VAEDNRVPPLPRRVPGRNRGPGAGPVLPPVVLSEPDLQRIRAALGGAADSDGAEDKASPPQNSAEDKTSSRQNVATSERLASLSRPVQEPGRGSESPAGTARPRLLSPRADEASTDRFPVISTSRVGGVAEEVTAPPDTAARPEVATDGSADAKVAPAQPPSPAVQHPDQQSRQDKAASPDKTSVHRENGQASLEKAPPRRTKAAVRSSKPAPPRAPAPPPKPSPPRGRRRRPDRIGTAVILLAIVLAAGSVAFVLTRHASPARAKTTVGIEMAERNRAAAWVASQVSLGVPIACDQLMCRALEAHRIPAGDLLVLRPGNADPLHSGVIVVTAAVTRMIGSRLANDTPATIASFGSGNVQVSIRLIMPHGAAAYASALREGLAARKQAEIGLLQNQRITVSATARRQIAGGQVDSRLILTIAMLASQWPVSITAFGDPVPGASPGIPLRYAYLAQTGGADANPPDRARLMSGFVHELGGLYVNAHFQVVQRAGVQVLRIGFKAPSPLSWVGGGPLTQ
jgi:hypothetical protein